MKYFSFLLLLSGCYFRTPAPVETPHQLFNCTDGNGQTVPCSGVHDNGTHNFGPGGEPTDAEKKAKADGTYSPKPN